MLALAAEAAEIANAIDQIVAGHSSVAVQTAFGMSIGAGESEREHPHLDDTMVRIARVAFGEFHRRRAAKLNG
ncbi:MAG: hypothetical protein WAP03_13175 [Methylorubrum rhodinum]|uniref:hypothetical protein n=1 Tax=Methylorubrum rhodinum TaxID=29428 RepID=UPI003BB0F3D2